METGLKSGKGRSVLFAAPDQPLAQRTIYFQWGPWGSSDYFSNSLGSPGSKIREGAGFSFPVLSFHLANPQSLLLEQWFIKRVSAAKIFPRNLLEMQISKHPHYLFDKSSDSH